MLASVGAGVLLIAAGYAGWLALFAVGTERCSFEIKDQRVSPKGDLKAAMLVGSCGATTPTASVVVLTGVHEKVSFERDRVAAFRGVAGGLAWTGDGLSVSYNGIAHPTQMIRRHRGTDISYSNP